MASIFQSAVRRSSRALYSTVFKAPTRQALRSTSAFQYSATTRDFTSLHQQSGLAAQSQRYRSQLAKPRSQLRWFSEKSGNDLRQWGFEDINATLPAEEPSPTHTPVLIDVREPAELTGTGIIPHALSIPLASQPDALFLTADEFKTRFGFPKPLVDPKHQLVFYCKAGVRARAAAQLAVQAGYDPEQIGVYDGSWLDWERNGGKVERWEGHD
ncbi:hypothetical protein N7532_010677 [Penicillium argentinense]|uniref:Rhodanese domain-containing protein n=1 Tax=Penicillium argentinense TaxID=1131581 RepID=A0A9W9JYC8_9EURO|nr:uncharacterized protein N7532_010677 [Penicillium argentinense]KAJ5085906.1 hypothetical protein N7532_010677 [Penicillium argentinense]